jgi:tetratricopeptide (TPR) repeat protein
MIKHRRTLICCLLVLTTLVVYGQLLHCEFIRFDDPVYVTQNSHVTGGLKRDGIIWAFTTGHAGNWHPLTWLSHMLDAQLFGLRAGFHHVTSVLLHVANSLLLLLLLTRLTGALWRSAFVAFLFALHPLHVESVAWISERKDVLSTFFWLLTLLTYAWYVQKSRIFPYLLSLTFFAMGLMAKPMLVTTPFLLLLLDYWPLKRWTPADGGPPKRGGTPAKQERTSLSKSVVLVREKLPFVALASISIWVTLVVQRRGGAMSSLEVLPLQLRYANALVAYVGYLKKTLWPFNLAVFYPYATSIPSWTLVFSALALIGLTVLVFHYARSFPFLSVGWFWYLGTLVPVVGLIQVGEQAMADRYTYIPTVGLFIAVTWIVADLIQQRSRLKPVLAMSATILIAACAITTWVQLRSWMNSLTLFEHAIQVTENNYMAYGILGMEYADRGDLEKAVSLYQSALNVNPKFTLARNGLGVALARQGKQAAAVDQFTWAIQIKPGNATAHFNLGVIYEEQGKSDLAIQHYADALRLGSGSTDASFRLAVLLATLGRTAEAIKAYYSTLQLQPERLEALNNLAWILATNNDPKYREGIEAVKLAERACELTRYGNAVVLDTLSAAYAEAGRFEDAVRTEQKAIDLAHTSGQKELADNLQKNLKLFFARRAIREQ